MGRGIGTDGCNFIVIGGGPAGASAAARLARSGADVVLLERRRMPRDKLCGGALSVRAINYLGFPVPRSLVDAEAYGVRIHMQGSVVEAAQREPIAVLVTRSRFDEFLIEKARECGARIKSLYQNLA